MPAQIKKLSRQDLLDASKEAKQKYVLIENKVYDVTDFVDEHPGGIVILTHVGGEDATEVFNAFHPPAAYETLADYYYCDYDPEADLKAAAIRKDAFGAEIEQLRVECYKEGLFESSKLFYVYKVMANYAILALAVYLLRAYPTNVFAFVSSALALGVFWQQSGWLAHDFLHHQVFKNRQLNNAMGYLLGNIGQGFSVDWWKNKHNSHHASPNIHGLDPDVDTMPLLAWSEHAVHEFAAENPGWLAEFMIFNQNQLYWILLSLARLSWCKSSLSWVLESVDPKKDTGKYVLEVSTLLLHWSLYFYFAISSLESWSATLAYIALSQMSCGLLLSFCFSLNHNGMPIYHKDEAIDMDFYRKQVLTGRDVHPTFFSTWFTGGLNYQIEHHLFPSMPRHNFHKIQAKVQEICEKHNVKYHVTDFMSGTKEIMQRLQHVSEYAIKAKKL